MKKRLLFNRTGHLDKRYRRSGGFREALADLTVKLSNLVIRHGCINEIEFNPVFLYEDEAVIGMCGFFESLI